MPQQQQQIKTFHAIQAQGNHRKKI
uniref:Uncharacterized protein n=1 Tax=Rhizophora mucronata TaxID=61149 RepID=A0A2P2NW85_RHIMU